MYNILSTHKQLLKMFLKADSAKIQGSPKDDILETSLVLCLDRENYFNPWNDIRFDEIEYDKIEFNYHSSEKIKIYKYEDKTKTKITTLNQASGEEYTEFNEYYGYLRIEVQANDLADFFSEGQEIDNKLSVIFKSGEEVKYTIEYTLYFHHFYFEADFSNTGNANLTKASSPNSKWEKDKAPNLLVDCKKALSEQHLSKFKIKYQGTGFPLDEGNSQIVPVIQLAFASDINRIQLYQKIEGKYKRLIDENKKRAQIRWIEIFENADLQAKELEAEFYATALEFPNGDFNGLLTLTVKYAFVFKAEDMASKETADKLVDFYTHTEPDKRFILPESSSTGICSLQFRVAPWIMNPHHLEAKKLYVSDTQNTYFDGLHTQSNAAFIKQLKAAIGEEKVEKAPINVNRDDQWMQDQIEFGYTQKSENQQLNVVLNSPRNRGLDLFPIIYLQKNEYGYVTAGGTSEQNSLDSFGNLEVVPPLSNYPMGRIYYGGSEALAAKYHPSVNQSDHRESRDMMLSVREFLYAQKVQKPFCLYSDWLRVGHVDEFVTFIPSSKGNGALNFKIVLTSPDACYKFLRNCSEQDSFFVSRKRSSGLNAQMTAKELLDDNLVGFNFQCQKALDFNKEILKFQLGATDEDFVELPGWFHGVKDKADALIPGMINLVVFNEHILMAKPFGPKDKDGKCVIEKEVEKIFEEKIGENLKVHFIDDWYPYHLFLGEVHCGTNVLRKSFEKYWWNSPFLSESDQEPNSLI